MLSEESLRHAKWFCGSVNYSMLNLYCFLLQTGQPGGGVPGGPQQQPQQQQPGGGPQQPGQGAPQQQQAPYGQPYGYQAAAAAGYYGGAPGMYCNVHVSDIDMAEVCDIKKFWLVEVLTCLV